MSEQDEPTRPAKHRVKASGPLNRLRDNIPAPTREVARARIRSQPGFFASLSEEVIEMFRNFDGPEVSGPRRDREGL